MTPATENWHEIGEKIVERKEKTKGDTIPKCLQFLSQTDEKVKRQDKKLGEK